MQLENRGAVTRHCCGARRPIDHQSLPSFMRRSLPHDFGTPTPSAQHTPVRPVRRRSPSLFHPAASIFSLSFFPSSLFPTTGARASPRGSCAAGQSRRSRGGSDETEHSVPFRLSVPPWVELASGGEVLPASLSSSPSSRVPSSLSHQHPLYYIVGEIERAQHTSCDVATVPPDLHRFSRLRGVCISRARHHREPRCLLAGAFHHGDERIVEMGGA